MISSFSYWDSADQSQVSNFAGAWMNVLPDHKIIGPDAAAALITHYFEDSPQYLDAFSSIRIPAAKSDIARYLALYRFGGLYMDVHFGYHNLSDVETFLASSAQYDATLVNVAVSTPRRTPTQVRVINGLIICKPEHPLLLSAAKMALENVSAKKLQEEMVGYEPYNIFSMTGPGLLNEVFFVRPLPNQPDQVQCLRAEAMATKIENEEDVPIKRNIFKAAYSIAGNHWSERQGRELLFVTGS